MPLFRSMLSAATVLASASLAAAAGTAAPADSKAPASLLPGANSHEPINIDAGKLDFFNKEQKLVYSGGVVAVQGDSTLKASQLTIFLAKNPDAKDPDKKATANGEPPPAAASASTPPGAGSSVKRMEVTGPVTIVSKDQIGTGDNAIYDKEANKVTMTGNVTLSQGTNVTKGDRLIYDLNTSQAQIFSGQTYGRVRSVFTPGSQGADDGPLGAGAGKKKASPKPKAAGTASAQ